MLRRLYRPIKRTLASWSYRRFLIILRMIPYMRLVQERLVLFFIFKSYQRKINYILSKIHLFSLFDQVSFDHLHVNWVEEVRLLKRIFVIYCMASSHISITGLHHSCYNWTFVSPFLHDIPTWETYCHLRCIKDGVYFLLSHIQIFTTNVLFDLYS